MSESNIEVVRRALQARFRGDVEGTVAHFHPQADIDFTEMRGPYGGRHYRGGEGFVEVEQLIDEAWADATWETEEIDEGECVIVVFHMKGVGRTSGIPVEATGAGIFTLRDGKIVRYRQCQDRDDAMRVLALERAS